MMITRMIMTMWMSTLLTSKCLKISVSGSRVWAYCIEVGNMMSSFVYFVMFFINAYLLYFVLKMYFSSWQMMVCWLGFNENITSGLLSFISMHYLCFVFSSLSTPFGLSWFLLLLLLVNGEWDIYIPTNKTILTPIKLQIIIVFRVNKTLYDRMAGLKCGFCDFNCDPLEKPFKIASYLGILEMAVVVIMLVMVMAELQETKCCDIKLRASKSDVVDNDDDEPIDNTFCMAHSTKYTKY
ncbi:hypothetical protein FF38_12007 [Lucilia cuprina]|uniref:Uncharacterized protein n=1 Tax=Lucilia cuprina TaxID=7375 RepID=A0A0L0CFH5_LUCCU|nr:hypothetical protein FF38_12007 [Lucilia cuprina]